MTEYLYNSDGVWIASRMDRMLFDREGHWAGWMPWGDGEVVDPAGEYLGTIVEGNRLYRDESRKAREVPGYPGRPEDAESDYYPGFAGGASIPPNMSDVSF